MLHRNSVTVNFANPRAWRNFPGQMTIHRDGLGTATLCREVTPYAFLKYGFVVYIKDLDAFMRDPPGSINGCLEALVKQVGRKSQLPNVPPAKLTALEPPTTAMTTCMLRKSSSSYTHIPYMPTQGEESPTGRALKDAAASTVGGRSPVAEGTYGLISAIDGSIINFSASSLRDGDGGCFLAASTYGYPEHSMGQVTGTPSIPLCFLWDTRKGQAEMRKSLSGSNSAGMFIGCDRDTFSFFSMAQCGPEALNFDTHGCQISFPPTDAIGNTPVRFLKPNKQAASDTQAAAKHRDFAVTHMAECLALGLVTISGEHFQHTASAFKSLLTGPDAMARTFQKLAPLLKGLAAPDRRGTGTVALEIMGGLDFSNMNLGADTPAMERALDNPLPARAPSTGDSRQNTGPVEKQAGARPPRYSDTGRHQVPEPYPYCTPIDMPIPPTGSRSHQLVATPSFPVDNTCRPPPLPSIGTGGRTGRGRAWQWQPPSPARAGRVSHRKAAAQRRPAAWTFPLRP